MHGIPVKPFYFIPEDCNRFGMEFAALCLNTFMEEDMLKKILFLFTITALLFTFMNSCKKKETAEGKPAASQEKVKIIFPAGEQRILTV